MAALPVLGDDSGARENALDRLGRRPYGHRTGTRAVNFAVKLPETGGAAGQWRSGRANTAVVDGTGRPVGLTERFRVTVTRVIVSCTEASKPPRRSAKEIYAGKTFCIRAGARAASHSLG